MMRGVQLPIFPAGMKMSQIEVSVKIRFNLMRWILLTSGPSSRPLSMGRCHPISTRKLGALLLLPARLRIASRNDRRSGFYRLGTQPANSCKRSPVLPAPS